MKPPRDTSLKPARLKAFSLIEMLITITVIGIIVGLCMLYFGSGQRQAIIDAKDHRNAQEVISLCVSAEVCGASVIASGDMRRTIQNLTEGRTAAHGPFAGKTFRLNGLSEEEITGAMRYLDWSQDRPVYLPQGRKPPQ